VTAQTVFIISIAQQARPNVAGHKEDFRAQLTTASSFTVITSGNDSNNVFSKPIIFIAPLCRGLNQNAFNISYLF
jgi:hypothetical protein